MNRWVLSTISVLVLMFFSSCFCPLTSVNPLSDPQNPTYDERIEGAWQLLAEDGDLVFLHFGKGDEKKTEMISIEHKNNREIDVLSFTVFPTIVNGQNYLNFNIRELFKEFGDELSGYTFMKYHLTGTDTLRLSHIDEEPIIEGIKSGKLKGEITYKQTQAKEGHKGQALQQNKKKSIKCVKITDSSDNIVKYIHSVDSKKIFPKSIILKRIEPQIILNKNDGN